MSISRKIAPVIAVLFATSCVMDKESNTETSVDTTQTNASPSLERIVDEQLASGINSNDIFLDFEFGMSRQKLNNSVEKMVKQKKLKVIDGKIVYMLDLGEQRKEVLISPFYNENRLYELGLTISGADFQDVCDLYHERYADHVEYASVDTTGETQAFYLIKGNKQIKISRGEEVKIFYTDLDMQRKLGIKEGEKKKSGSKSLNDL